jgi:hypothetical protein
VNSTTNKRLLSLLVNDDFINYVLNPNLILKEMWEDYMSTHPEDIPVLNEAKYILLGGNELNRLSNEDVSNMQHDIFEKCGLASC